MTGSGPDNSSKSQRLIPIRQAVAVLDELIKELYPEPPSPDVITLDDFQLRYRLTGLGPPAVRAIEQTQRINRTLNNYQQMGLCEFHIGLFYLHWGECQGSIKQFDRARQQWSFIDAAASICLAHFAEGRAHHLAYEYEVAMSHYSKAAQWLMRIHFTAPSDRQDNFVRQMTEYLDQWQARLRDDMLPDFKKQKSEAAAGDTESPTPEDEPAEEEATGQQPADTAAPPEVRPGSLQQVAPLPIVNIGPQPDWTSTPIPAHRNTDEDLAWYEVEQVKAEDEHFLPDVIEGTWVLVRTETTGHEFRQNELIVIVQSERTGGSIILKPHSPGRPFQRITYLLAKSLFTGRFARDDSKVALSPDTEQPVKHTDILGIVVGFWVPALAGTGQKGT